MYCWIYLFFQGKILQLPSCFKEQAPVNKINSADQLSINQELPVFPVYFFSGNAVRI
jgi:hypothetical protein